MVIILEPAHNDLAGLERQLANKVAQAPNFFRDILLVMALDKLSEGKGRLDLSALFEVCRRHGLRTLAVRVGREGDTAAAQALDLSVLPPSGACERLPDIEDSASRKPAGEPSPSTGEARSEPAKTEEKPAEPVGCPTKVVKTPVYGGMQVYAAGGDLIVLATVSPGVELLADGNIHVYDSMCGRAPAGVKGNVTARISCQRLAAELVSIVGDYKVTEDLRRSPQWDEVVYASLSGDMLNIARL